jgi:hypothetical protein
MMNFFLFQIAMLAEPMSDFCFGKMVVSPEM